MNYIQLSLSVSDVGFIKNQIEYFINNNPPYQNEPVIELYQNLKARLEEHIKKENEKSQK